MTEAVLDIKFLGNSLGVRLPAAVARTARLTAHQRVRITVEDGRVIITPQGRKALSLAERLGVWAADFQRTSEFGQVLPRHDGFGDFEHARRVIRLAEH